MTFGLAVAQTRDFTRGSLKFRDHLDRIENGDADIPANDRVETTIEIVWDLRRAELAASDIDWRG
jgi:hypothetical protein